MKVILLLVLLALPTLQGDVIGYSGDGNAISYGDSSNTPSLVKNVSLPSNAVQVLTSGTFY